MARDTQPLSIRETPLGAPVVRRLLDGWHEELLRRNPGFVPERASMVAPGDFEPPGGVLLVASQGKAEVGCAGLRRLGDGIGEIKRVFVSPAARGRGVASALLIALEERARSLGYGTLRLDTDGREPAALALFRSLGYEPIGDYNGNPYARGWFQKRLV